MKNKLYKMDDPLQEAKEVLEEIVSLTSAKKHLDLWQRILTAQWLEVVELSRLHNLSASTGRGVAHLLITEYRKNKKNKRMVMKRVLNFVELMYSEMEGGRDLRRELEPLARELGIGKINRLEVLSSSTTHTHEENQVSVEYPIVLSASEPLNRSYALKEQCEKIAEQIPPPELNKFAGAVSIGKAKAEERAEWIAWIDKVAHTWSAPLYASDLVKISGANARWVNAMYNEYKALLAQGLDQENKKSMALGLVAEAESIAREAFALYATSEDDRSKGACLKLALDALDRRLKILHITPKDLEKTEVKAGSSIEEQAEKLGLTEQNLKEIADLASKSMKSEIK